MDIMLVIVGLVAVVFSSIGFASGVIATVIFGYAERFLTILKSKN